jgi:hypothetical protein
MPIYDWKFGEKFSKRSQLPIIPGQFHAFVVLFAGKFHTFYATKNTKKT